MFCCAKALGLGTHFGAKALGLGTHFGAKAPGCPGGMVTDQIDTCIKKTCLAHVPGSAASATAGTADTITVIWEPGLISFNTNGHYCEHLMFHNLRTY